MLNEQTRVYVAGHRGLAGSSIVRALEARGVRNLITEARANLNLTRQSAVDRFFRREKPEIVVLAAARVGGILANSTEPADFIRENLLIQTNVIDAAYRHGARKLLFLGSSCIYPRDAAQPMRESALLSGPLEPTNAPYALAKLSGIMMCQAYRQQYGFDAISVLPTNLYGPGDNFDDRSSHVLPGLMARIHTAKQRHADHVSVWGSGSPRREFLFIDDFADAACFALEHIDDANPVNIGCGVDVSIRELAELLCEVIGFHGELRFDASKPDGTPRKLLDVSRLASLGWVAKTSLREGIAATYRWYVNTLGSLQPLAGADYPGLRVRAVSAIRDAAV